MNTKKGIKEAIFGDELEGCSYSYHPSGRWNGSEVEAGPCIRASAGRAS